MVAARIGRVTEVGHRKAEVRREKEKLDEKLGKKPGKQPDEKLDKKPDEKLGKKLDKELDERRERPERRELPAPDFAHFVSGIAAQTLMQLGDIENPFEGGRKVDMESARYSIDLITMLEEKTKGNLTPDEERYLRAALHDLRMRFVEVASGKGPAGPGPEPDAAGGGDQP